MADIGDVLPAGKKAVLFNEEIFRDLRLKDKVPDNFVNTGWDLDQLVAGGGKGGTLMAFVGSEYIVKELSEGDHKALLEVSGSYGFHVCSGETLICPIYLHFQDTASGRKFFVMQNSLGKGPFKELYDLKGCADDKTIELDGKSIKAVHKRIWNVGMWCGKGSWTEERLRYYQGKQEAYKVTVPLTPGQREKFLRCLKRDTEWLASQRLMDYSLLVAVKESSGQESANGGGGPSARGNRLILQKSLDGKDISLHVSIIDILQKWTTGKKVARCLKVAEQNKATIPPALYAKRFYNHFQANFRPLLPDGDAEEERGGSPKPVAPPASIPEAQKPEEKLTGQTNIISL